MHIQEATNKERWDAFVAVHPGANYQHLFGWKTCLEKTYGIKTVYLELIDNDKIVGVFPLAISGITWLAPMAVSLSLCNYVGPLAVSKEHETILISQAIAFIRNRYPRIKGIEIRRTDPQGFCEKGFATMIMELPKNIEALLLLFSQNVRRCIRTAQKNNLIAKRGKEHFDEFYGIYARNLHRHGTPPHSSNFLRNIINEMSQYSELITIWNNQMPIAGMLFFKLNKTVSSCVVCSLREYNLLCPGHLVNWEALKFGVECGFKHFDFGRSTIGTSMYTFKERWGSRPIAIKYDHIMFNNKKSPDSKNKYSGKSATIFSKCWKIIPYSISLWLGPKIRKHIA